MRLPDIDYTAPVQESSSAIARVDQARRGALDTISAGLQALGQEMVKTQSQKAAADVEAGMASDEEYFAKNRYLPVDQVKKELGDAFEQLPAELRAQRQVVDDGQGNQVEVLPTYLVAGALFEKRNRDRIAAASKGIAGQGWQAAFQDSALQDLGRRKSQLALQQAHAMVQDFKETQSAVVDQYMRTHAYDRALDTVNHSEAFDPGEKALMREKVLQAKQVFETTAKVESTSAKILSDAQVPGYAWVDPEKALAAVAAIPDDDPQKAHVRELVEHQVARNEQLREAAGKQRMNEAQALLNRGASLQGPQLANIKAWMLDPPNGAAGLWDALERQQRAELRAARTSSAEERRAQAELDRTALAEFDRLDLKGEQGSDQVSVDVAASFPDVSRAGLALLQVRQKKARLEWQKDQGVSFTGFTAKVNETARSLGYGTKEQADFLSYMRDQYYSWKDSNPTKPAPKDEEVDKMLVDAVTFGNVSFGRDKEHWRLVRAGQTAPPAADQPDRVRAVLQRGGRAPAAPGAPAAPAKPTAGMPRRTDPKTGETRVWNGSAWVKE